MGIFHEEVFGPVAQLHPVRDADEALDLANATEYASASSAT
jgi:acyl-CoA reductase-like NAD-dependent aldehyde dehydrogenase